MLFWAGPGRLGSKRSANLGQAGRERPKRRRRRFGKASEAGVVVWFTQRGAEPLIRPELKCIVMPGPDPPPLAWKPGDPGDRACRDAWWEATSFNAPRITRFLSTFKMRSVSSAAGQRPPRTIAYGGGGTARPQSGQMHFRRGVAAGPGTALQRIQ